MDSDEIRHELATQRTPLHEIAEVRTFRAHRETTEGGEEKITFEFFDYGPEYLPMGRYLCIATTESGHTVTGHNADTIAEALTSLQWKKLDAG